MAPWDELTWFLAPVETVVSLSMNVAKQLVGTNPQRTGLLIGLTTSGTAVNLSMKSSVSGSTGLLLLTNPGLLALNARDHPSLPQSAWWAFSSTNLSIWVVEIAMRDWPRGQRAEDNNDSIARAIRSLARRSESGNPVAVEQEG